MIVPQNTIIKPTSKISWKMDSNMEKWPRHLPSTKTYQLLFMALNIKGSCEGLCVCDCLSVKKEKKQIRPRKCYCNHKIKRGLAVYDKKRKSFVVRLGRSFLENQLIKSTFICLVGTTNMQFSPCFG